MNQKAGGAMLALLAGLVLPAVVAGGKLAFVGVSAWGVGRALDALDDAGVQTGWVSLEEVPDPYAPLRGEEGVSLLLDEGGRLSVKVHLGCLVELDRTHPGKPIDEIIRMADREAQRLGAPGYEDLREQDRSNRRKHAN